MAKDKNSEYQIGIDWDAAATAIQERQRKAGRQNLGITEGINPDKRAEALSIEADSGIPANIVEHDPERAKRHLERQKIDYGKLIDESPALAQWLAQDRDNAAISRDDLIKLGVVEEKRKNIGAMSGFGVIANRARGGFARARMALTATAMAMGVISQSEAAESIAALEQEVRERQQLEPASVMMFEQENQRIISGIDDGLVQTTELELLWNLLRNPTSFLASSAGSMATSVPGLVSGAGGAVVGTAAGGPKGGAIGFIGGTFAGGVPVETGSFMMELLGKQGVDIGDPNALLAAFRDEELLRDVRNRATRKGITTAGVDALFAAVGGRFVPRGTTLGRKAAGVAADVGIQMIGEGAGEFAGQVAALGFEEASFGEAAFEALIGGGTAIVQTTIGASIREPFQFVGRRRAESRKKRIVSALETAGTAEQIMEAAQSLNEAKSTERAPDRVRAFMEAAAGEDGAKEVYFQADEWTQFFTEQGISPISAAEAAGLSPNELSTATETGGSFKLGMDKFLLSYRQDTRLREILGMARFSADGQSVNEAVALLDKEVATTEQGETTETETVDPVDRLEGVESSIGEGVVIETSEGVVDNPSAIRRLVVNARQNVKIARALAGCL